MSFRLLCYQSQARTYRIPFLQESCFSPHTHARFRRAVFVLLSHRLWFGVRFISTALHCFSSALCHRCLLCHCEFACNSYVDFLMLFFASFFESIFFYWKLSTWLLHFHCQLILPSYTWHFIFTFQFIISYAFLQIVSFYAAGMRRLLLPRKRGGGIKN